METMQLPIDQMSLSFEYIRILDSVDPNGHFGTHEKKSRGDAW